MGCAWNVQFWIWNLMPNIAFFCALSVNAIWGPGNNGTQWQSTELTTSFNLINCGKKISLTTVISHSQVDKKQELGTHNF